MGGILKHQDIQSTGHARDFHYTRRDFERVRDLLYQHAGISLSDSKDQLVYSRLARRLRLLGIARFDDYLDALSPEVEEWQSFLNALTTNLTAFFREAHHFEAMAHYLAQRKSTEPLRVWCSASSTGEEPYSIAMTILECMGSAATRADVLASDLDTNVLQKARDGVYPIDRIERIDKQRLQQFFQRGSGSKEGLVRVRPEVKKIVRFAQINLLAPGWPVEGPLDIIFCRNVLIYFDKPTQKQIVERFLPLLRPDGRLFVGHSENLATVTDAFELIGKTVYKPARHRGPHGQ